MIALSLGWGVQSFTLAAMSALGELPRVDAAIHSDTTHERSATYEFAEQMTPLLAEHGIKVVTVRPTRTLSLERGRVKSVQLPVFTQQPPFWEEVEYEDGYKGRVWRDGKGQLRRQCTNRWKIQPMRRWLQANRNGEPVEMWIGISWDEIQRMRDSDVKYVTNRWPLIERRMTRQDCIKWLQEHSIPVPSKSSCVFCPFHNRAAWRELRQSCNGDWSKAIAVDEAIRKARPPYDLYLHSSRKPLSEIGDGIDAQPELFDAECTGYCFT